MKVLLQLQLEGYHTDRLARELRPGIRAIRSF